MNDETIPTAARAHLETSMRMIEEDTKRYKVNCEVNIVLNNVTFGTPYAPVVLGVINSDTLEMVYFSAVVFDNTAHENDNYSLEFAGPLELVVNENNENVGFKQAPENFDFWGRYGFGKFGIRMPSSTRFCIAEMIAEQLK